ncbi:MAG: Na(+)/H(+) antiporter subunit A [Candidatus Omnitrophica bacterium]|nr:Na(+)/H(+) antiporter subunit A [Candidatus Omnitrophota bacterium]
MASAALLPSYPVIGSGNGLTWSAPWVPGLGFQYALRLDGLSFLFAMLISGIGLLIFIYARTYMAGEPGRVRFFSWLTVFMASMLGLVLSDDVLLLFVCWELTSVSSYFLIGHRHREEGSRAAAHQALMVTGIGGLALLCGLLILSSITGTTRLSEMAGAPGLLGNPLTPAAVVLILAGCCTKSAQWPFHFWLPNAMAAPTPVSAYLHSSTMVKAGVYLALRCHPILSGAPGWGCALAWLGAATALAGTVSALRERDMKRQLAYLTVGALGTLMLLIGLGSEKALQAVVVYLVAHALYKGSLFMLVGGVDHATGTRDASELGGLRKVMPITAGCAMAAAVSLAGAPPSMGFIGKESLLGVVWPATPDRLYALVAYLSGTIMAALALWVALRPFWGPTGKASAKAHESAWSLLCGPVVLSVGSILPALVPGSVEGLLSAAASSALGRSTHVHLSLWHGWGPPLWIGLAALATGWALYGIARRKDAPVLRADFPGPGPEALYTACMKALPEAAARVTLCTQADRLRDAIRTFVVVLTLAVGGTLAVRGPWPALGSIAAHPHEIWICVLIIVTAIAAIRLAERFAIVAVLGATGLGVTMIFVLYGAPDLAMTQFAVETLTVILLALVLHRFSMLETGRSSSGQRAVDLFVASCLGVLMWALASVALHGRQGLSASSQYFSETSLVSAHGRNIVNVIIVDFRGIDTMGEITVLAVAGIGVYALLKARLPKDGQR